MTDKENIVNSILIVDDQPQNIQLIGTLLRNSYNLYVADNGERAVKIAIDKKPDLILLDIMMPVITGFDVCKILKSNSETKDIPIIFLTAKNEAEDIVKGFQLGAVDYITKPFKREEVHVRISSHIKLKETEKELKKKNEELEAINNELLISRNTIEKNAQALELLNQEKDKFFSIIAHDLKNPLAGFLGLTQMVSENIDDISADKVKQYMEMMYNSADQLNKLLSNLLEWASLQMGNVKFVLTKNDLGNAAGKAITFLNNAIVQKNIMVENNIPKNTVFYFDLNMLETVLRNLLSNALKYTKKGGQVVVSSELKDKVIVISVKDSGIGIPPELAGKIFSIKEVVSRKGTDGEASTGLGLILCKSFIEKNNGNLWFDTTEGKGTTFYVSLPFSND
jgi:two-component system, sensor histidine kinase and response regulator